jgi:hypothetical protein
MPFEFALGQAVPRMAWVSLSARLVAASTRCSILSAGRPPDGRHTLFDHQRTLPHEYQTATPQVSTQASSRGCNMGCKAAHLNRKASGKTGKRGDTVTEPPVGC